MKQNIFFTLLLLSVLFLAPFVLADPNITVEYFEIYDIDYGNPPVVDYTYEVNYTVTGDEDFTCAITCDDNTSVDDSTIYLRTENHFISSAYPNCTTPGNHTLEIYSCTSQDTSTTFYDLANTTYTINSEEEPIEDTTYVVLMNVTAKDANTSAQIDTFCAEVKGISGEGIKYGADGFWEFNGSLVESTGHSTNIVCSPYTPEYGVNGLNLSINGNPRCYDSVDTTLRTTGAGAVSWGGFVTPEQVDSGTMQHIFGGNDGVGYSLYANDYYGLISANHSYVCAVTYDDGEDGLLVAFPDGAQNESHHLSCVLDRAGNTTLLAYMDGVNVASATLGVISGLPMNDAVVETPNLIYFGADGIFPVFDMQLHNMFVYKKALSETEVALLASGLVPDFVELVCTTNGSVMIEDNVTNVTAERTYNISYSSIGYVNTTVSVSVIGNETVSTNLLAEEEPEPEPVTPETTAFTWLFIPLVMLALTFYLIFRLLTFQYKSFIDVIDIILAFVILATLGLSLI
jgi:hypothetical protein